MNRFFNTAGPCNPHVTTPLPRFGPPWESRDEVSEGASFHYPGVSFCWARKAAPLPTRVLIGMPC
jgi:hypothetical protein